LCGLKNLGLRYEAGKCEIQKDESFHSNTLKFLAKYVKNLVFDRAI
jgi:hypothetical protein